MSAGLWLRIAERVLPSLAKSDRGKWIIHGTMSGILGVFLILAVGIVIWQISDPVKFKEDGGDPETFRMCGRSKGRS